VLVAVLVGGCLVGCRPAGFRHRVKSGENLYRIGQAYGVDYRELARANGIDDPHRIEIGQRLIVPNATRELPVTIITPARARADAPAAAELPADRSPFVWPIEGRVVDAFGPRGETHHDGIDIAAAIGTPIRAARGGRVLYSDQLVRYGNVLIVDHGDGYVTVYAHNRLNAVGSDAIVRQGDVIGEVGDTGDASAPSLHFEVRKDNVARNPLHFLPPRRYAAHGGSRP
jgi:murein DD-endopeptidase MepM/ murein hydrolase activator NlpD